MSSQIYQINNAHVGGGRDLFKNVVSEVEFSGPRCKKFGFDMCLFWGA